MVIELSIQFNLSFLPKKLVFVDNDATTNGDVPSCAKLVRSMKAKVI
jgi:hypothetical protein